MAISTEIYSLFELRAAGRLPVNVLTRVERREFANWDQADEDRANQEAIDAADSLINRYSASLSWDSMTMRKVGELQRHAAGEGLDSAEHNSDIAIWVAETDYGSPWVVIGRASSEDLFWAGIESDEELKRLRPRKPARSLEVRFLTER